MLSLLIMCLAGQVLNQTLMEMYQNVTPYVIRTFFLPRAKKRLSPRMVAGTVGFD